MKHEISVFENEQFGSIRACEIDGEPWFVAADVCRALEIGNSSQALARLDEDEKGVILTDTPGGAQKMAYVNEPGLYTLILGSRKHEARIFKRWIAHDVIPSIRKTGTYAIAKSPAELLVAQAQALLEQEQRIASVESKLELLEANIETRPEHCYTIAGYASIRGIRLDVNRANMLGRKAAKLSREYDYEVSKTQDPRFGTVNVYHEDILKVVFDGERMKR